MDIEKEKLESLVVNILGKYNSDPQTQAKETLRIATEVANEIKKARTKCQSITQIEGHPASIIGLKMTGKTGVDLIGITYVSNWQRLERTYLKEDFYNI